MEEYTVRFSGVYEDTNYRYTVSALTWEDAVQEAKELMIDEMFYISLDGESFDKRRDELARTSDKLDRLVEKYM